MVLISDFYINVVVFEKKEKCITRWLGTGFFVGKESLDTWNTKVHIHYRN